MTDPYSVLGVSRDASDDEIIRTRIRQRRNSKKSSRPISRS